MDAALINTYKRYKCGTSKLLNWLHEGATRTDNKPITAKKLAKGNTATSSPTRIAVDTLIEYAKKIVAATDPTIEIPLDILDVAKDVIIGRQSCAAWYSALTAKQKGTLAAEFTDANGRHQHFIRVLEEVFEILRREHKTRRPKRKKKIELATDVDDLSNLYLHLELEEPADIDENAKPASRTSKQSRTPPKTKEVEIEDALHKDSNEEKLFQVWCHLRDLFELRLQSRKTWQQYVSGDISFFTACEVFDQAVRLATMLSAEFASEHPDLQCFPDIIRLLGEKEYVTSARQYQLSLASLIGDTVQELSISNQSEFLLQPAWSAIHDFGIMCKYVRGPWGCTCCYQGKEPGSIYPGHPFGKALLQIAGDLATVIDVTNTTEREEEFFYISDPYTMELLQTMTMQEPLNMRTGTLAATQMYMDVYDLLNGDTERGLRECAPLMEGLQHQIESSNAFCVAKMGELHPNIHICARNTAETQRISLRETENGVEGWRLSMGHLLDGNSNQIRRFVPSSILSTLPVLVGHATRNLLYGTTDRGLHMCNSAFVVQAAAHLYEAAKVQGSSKHAWPDMDLIVARERELCPFLRQADGTILGAAKQYCLAMGVNLSQVSGRRRVPLPKPSICEKKGVKLSNLSHFVGSTQGTGAHRHTRHIHTKTCFGLHNEMDLRTVYDSIKHFSETVGIKDAAIATQYRDTRRLNPGQLLQVLQEILSEDDIYLHFDLLGFWQRCVELLDDVYHAFYVNEMTIYRTSATKDTKFLYEFVNEILWDAAEAETKGWDSTETVLHYAGELIDDMIKSSGSKAVDAAYELCSGRIPEKLKPSRLYGPTAIAIKPTALARQNALPVREMYAAAYAPNRRPRSPVSNSRFGNNLKSNEGEEARSATLETTEQKILTSAQNAVDYWLEEGDSKEQVVKRIIKTMSSQLLNLNIQKRAVVFINDEGEIESGLRELTEDEAGDLVGVMKGGIKFFSPDEKLEEGYEKMVEEGLKSILHREG